MGSVDRVGLVSPTDVTLLVPALVQENATAEVIFTGPLRAPLTAGTQVAEMIIHVPNLPDARVPLVVESDVGPGGFVKRLLTAAQELRARYLDQASAS